MRYFAYGSNLDWDQMRERCPSATFLCKAELPQYRLDFTRYSTIRKCGVSDVVEDPSGSVRGVVYEIGDQDVARLDKAEGYEEGRPTNSYWRRPITVIKDGVAGDTVDAETYFADQQPDPPLPSQDYVDHIIRGARYWELPADYIAGLTKIPTAPPA